MYYTIIKINPIYSFNKLKVTIKTLHQRVQSPSSKEKGATEIINFFFLSQMLPIAVEHDLHTGLPN